MPRILIIEDDWPLARLYHNLLIHEGYEVDVLTEGRGVEAALEEALPDVILLDLLLPDRDGWDILAMLQGDESTRSIPILVVTARGNDRDITRGLAMGASDYLVKPVHLAVLLARIATQVRLKEAQESLWRKNRELQELSEVKGRLVGVVSHELRTPLTSIRGALDLFSRGDELSPSRSRLVAICLRNTDRLIRLVNGVLSFARLEVGLELNSRPVDVEEAIQHAVEEISALVHSNDIKLRVALDKGLGCIIGDGDRIHQVLINLLSNAIKFSSARGEVVLRGSRRGERVRFEVQDWGPGIKVEDQPKLFLPFSQLHQDLPNSMGGTGLGLSISAEIVRRHAGKIGCISRLGEGSTFWFEIPALPLEA